MKQKQLTQTETAQVCSSLALLLHGGLGLADSFWLLAQEAEAGAECYSRIGQLLDEGTTLSAAMAESGIFPEYVTAMTRIGEQTGRLEETLAALGDYYLENTRTVRLLQQTLTYPCSILALMLVVIVLLLTKVLPVFDGVYASLGSRLTGFSGALLEAGKLLQGLLPGLLAVLVAAVVLALAVCLCAPVREKALAWWQKQFGDRGICRKFNNARFVRGLSMGVSGGLPLLEAAQLAGQLLASAPGGAQRAALCCRALEENVPLAEALQTGSLLPAWACRMVSVGIRGGNGDRVLEEVARRMMEEARNSLEDWAAKIEPAMVLLCSVLVGIILLSAMLPLMNIMASIG